METGQPARPSMARELAERIRGARQILLPEGGHFCPLTVTEAYNQALSRLLTDLNP